MPNHIQNKLVICGEAEDITRLINTIQTTSANGDVCYIDFNKIIPMPEELEFLVEGSDKTWGLAYYAIKNNKPEIIQKFCHYLTDAAIRLAEKPEDELERLYACGERAYNAYEKYGATSWYDWRVINWGTKWNAYETTTADVNDENTHIIYFQTAWNGAIPVIEKLVSMFPDLDFDYKYADEDFSYNTGIGWSDGEGGLAMNFPDGGSDEAVETYIECWDAEEDDYYKNDKGEWRCRWWDDEDDEEEDEDDEEDEENED